MNGLVCKMAKKVPALLVMLALFAVDSHAEYNRTPDSVIDFKVFKIDQDEFLGKRVDGNLALNDQHGNRFLLKELFGKPTILVLSYFRCDGVCSIVNADMKNMLEEVNRIKIGENYNVVSLSFDKFDNPETTVMFTDKLALSEEMAKDWKFATMANPEEIRKFTDSVGFNYFWSPRDQTFFHPSVYIILSPQGRIARYLFANTIESRDVELALLETGKGLIKPTEVLNLVVSYCFSYNFKEGKYTLNIPLFVAVGSLTLGLTSLAVAVTVFRRKLNKKGNLKEVG